MATVTTGVPHTVLLRGNPVSGEAPAATATIKPGMLIERTSADKVQPHSSAGQVAVAPLFARENELVGKGIDDLYALDDNVLFYHAQRGDWFYAFLAAGENVAIGERLQSNGAGALVSVLTDGDAVCQALQAVNNATGDPARIKVEVL